MKHTFYKQQRGRYMALFALLFLAFSSSLLAADDTEIVWQIKKEVYGSGQLLNNEKYIWLPSTEYYVIRDANTGEEFKRFKKNTAYTQGIVPYNNRTNYIHPNDENNKLYYYEANNFTIVDSLEKENNEIFGQLRKSNVDNVLYEISTEKILVWDIEQKKVVREMRFPKYEEPNLYSHEISSAIDCNNENIIVQHNKQYRPESNPNTWYDKKYITFYNALTLDSLGSLDITGGRFKLSSTCKYFVKIQGNIELYDFNTMKLLNTYLSPLTDIVFTSDDKYLITIDDVSINQMQVWDINQNLLIKTIKKGSSKILTITKDSKFALCNAGSTFFKLKLNLDPNSVEDENPILEDTKSYPNPTNNKVNLEFKLERPDVYNLKVIDMSGKEVMAKHIGNLNIGLNKIEIEKNNLSKGRYSVIIYSQNNSIKYNIIIGE